MMGRKPETGDKKAVRAFAVRPRSGCLLQLKIIVTLEERGDHSFVLVGFDGAG
jgi:hypothetical protein